MRRLGMWAAGYDCAIVLIGHLNKKEGSKGLYQKKRRWYWSVQSEEGAVNGPQV